MDRTSLARIERMNYLFGGALVAVSGVLGTLEHVLGALVGVLLSALNFSLLRRIVERMMLAAQGRADGNKAAGLWLLPKMVGLMAAAGAALLFLPISPIMLAVGFSVFLLSILVETVWYVLRSPADRSAGSQ